ncbi:MAG: aminotransferase class I/II-fold pyridoxal phosphate-dependent enzyme, partial [Desulfocucumaceae bacterium]
YRFLEYSQTDQLAAACDLYENAVSLGVMSKSYGLPGLRIGWLSTKNRGIYNKMAAFKDYTSICNSAPSEFIALQALKHRENIVRRNLNIINQNLSILDSFFVSYGEYFSWNRPKAGPIAFPRINLKTGAEEFCIDLLNKKGVLLLPGNNYDFGDRSFRIGFGRKNMPLCIDKLKEYIKESL